MPMYKNKKIRKSKQYTNIKNVRAQSFVNSFLEVLNTELSLIQQHFATLDLQVFFYLHYMNVTDCTPLKYILYILFIQTSSKFEGPNQWPLF